MDVDHEPPPSAAPTEGHRGWRRVQHHARRRRSTHLLLKTVVLGVGAALVIAGAVMLVVPGPGWAAIILGLIVLASEFAWAERALAPLRRFVDHWLVRLRERHPVLLRLLTAAGLAAAAAGLAATVWWLLR